MNKVHSSTQFKCELCEKWFNNQTNLNNHSVIHIESNVKCKLCYKLYSNRPSLAKHVDQYHSKKPKVQCNHCHKLLSSEENLKLHHLNCSKVKKEH